MASNPVVVNPATSPTPVSGSLAEPVNGNFAGPNAMGVLNDLPPTVKSGANFSPFVAINGTNQNKLGIQGAASPKTHGQPVSYYSSTQQQQTPKRGPGVHKTITNAANNGGGLVRITATGHGFSNGAKVDVTGVLGCTEANGTGWVSILIDANNFDLTGSAFVHAYTSGGLASLQ